MRREEIIKKIAEHSVLIKETRDDVKEIKQNDLPHIKKAIEQNNSKVANLVVAFGRFRISHYKWLLGIAIPIIILLITVIFTK